jgi:NADH-quinone oxidoreductase subunit G
MADVTLTVDGKKLTAPAGTLLIEACRMHGIEIPAFCYYPGLSLQAACRMCVVRLEKVPKLQTACTTPVAEGMVVTTESPEIAQARKATLELLLGNHPLDCPVCDAGGECELQDMTFKYGAHESKFVEIKQHRDEQQWSPVVFFDRPRCILCYRCVRVCGEGMDVWALGVQNRGAGSVIAPNKQDHLECEECGMCIDICPVGALTSGAYRYKTRPWEMSHVGTVCTHCGDGCKTTLGVRRANDGMDIVRGDNRDKSGINGDFLCIKGRYAFDFANRENRLTKPMIRKANGRLEEVTWDDALEFAGNRLREIRDTRGGSAIGVIGSNRTTNEESYLLQKFARTVLATNNIDHHRTADYPTFAAALKGNASEASLRDIAAAKAILLLGNDPTEQHPGLAWQIRTNIRHNQARLYVANHALIKLRRQATAFLQISEDGYAGLVSWLGGAPGSLDSNTDATAFRDALRKEDSLVVVFGSEFRGRDLSALVAFGATLPNVKFACLGDYANSRGAADMGLYPDLLPGYMPVSVSADFAREYPALPGKPGLNLLQMFDAVDSGQLGALYIVGSNPVARYARHSDALQKTFIIVQDMFMTETAQFADVILPAANLYEKSGTVTNTFGDLQLVKKAADRAGVRTDFELIVRLAAAMGADVKKLVPFGKNGTRADFGQARGAQSGEADRHGVWLVAHNLEPKLSPFDPFAIFDEIQRLVPSYDVPRLDLLTGNDQHLQPALVQIENIASRPDLVLPSNDTLFTSGSLGLYSKTLHSVLESRKPVETAAGSPGAPAVGAMGS